MTNYGKYIDEFAQICIDDCYGNWFDEEMEEKIKNFIIKSLLEVNNEAKDTARKKLIEKSVTLNCAVVLTHLEKYKEEEVKAIIKNNLIRAFASKIYDNGLFNYTEKINNNKIEINADITLINFRYI